LRGGSWILGNAVVSIAEVLGEEGESLRGVFGEVGDGVGGDGDGLGGGDVVVAADRNRGQAS